MLRKFARFLKTFTLCLVIFVFVYVGVFYTLSFMSSTVKLEKENKEERTVTVYLSTNGVHTDFVLPLNTEVLDWRTKIAIPDPSVQWLAFGWGDRGFYVDTPTWSELRVSTALRAISGTGDSAMHVSAYRQFVLDDTAVELTLTKMEYQQLINYIDTSFQKDNMKYQRIDAPGYGPFDMFYSAKGSYSLFYTCNTWVNQGLKQINQKAAVWTLHDQGIFRHYK